MNRVNKPHGFTLIELVIIIVLLGILAVVAVPKFINATDDARANVIEQLFTQVQTTVELNHGFAQVKNKTQGEQIITLEEIGDYDFISGYPATRSEATSPNRYFFDLMNLGLKGDETTAGSARVIRFGELNTYETDSVSRIGFGSDDLTAGNCYVQYQLGIDNRPEVTRVIAGCN